MRVSKKEGRWKDCISPWDQNIESEWTKKTYLPVERKWDCWKCGSMKSVDSGNGNVLAGYDHGSMVTVMKEAKEKRSQNMSTWILKLPRI